MASTSGASLPPVSNLTCPICCDKFKQPKMLPCGHSFCDGCVRPLFDTNPPTCPVCRESATVTCADQLPTNFSLKALVESDPRPFQKVAMSRLFGECTEHGIASDRYCRSCDRQVCKDCVKERHASSTTHEVALVATVVVEQREKLEAIMKDVYAAEEQIAEVAESIASGSASCQAEASQLLNAISDSANATSRATATETDSLKSAVERNKAAVLERVSSLRGACSELCLLVDEVKDIGHSFHKDLEKHNVSRSNAMESFSEKRDNVLKRIARMTKGDYNFNIGLTFYGKNTPGQVGKLVAPANPVPTAVEMRIITLSDPVSCGFIWPEIAWMMNVSTGRGVKHNFMKISNYHFLKGDFDLEIGTSKPLITVTREMSRDGKSTLCLTESGVHRYTLPPVTGLRGAGEIRNSVSLKNVAAIAWDENRVGCYALLGDGKTIKHLDMDACKVTKEVGKLVEKVRIDSRWGGQPMYVSSNGSLAVCDQIKRVIHFYEAIDSGELPKVISAPADQAQGVTPDCAMTREGDRLWYALWKMKTSSGGFDKAVLYAYDPSFKIVGKVAEFKQGRNQMFDQKVGDNCSLCFQGEFVAIKVYDEVCALQFT